MEYTDKEDKDSGSFRNVENFFSDSEIEPEYAAIDELMSKLEDEYSEWAENKTIEYIIMTKKKIKVVVQPQKKKTKNKKELS